MVATRYRNALAYAPGYASGEDYTAAPPRRNSLTDAAVPLAPASFGSPMIAGAAPSAPMAAPGPSLSGGSGQISGAPAPYLDGGAGGSAQGEYGGPGPTGAPSTGNFGQDVMGFGRNAGGAVASMALGGPMGVMGVAGIGALAGALRAAGFNSLAETLFSANFGMPSLGRASDPYSGISQEAVAQSFGQTPASAAAEIADAETATQYGLDATDQGVSADNQNTNSTAAGQDAAGPQESGFGGGAAGLGDQAGVGGPPGTDDAPAFREGGYTGDDGDGDLEPMDATLHEGEFVIRPEAVRMYGKDFFGALNAGQMPPNMLAGAMRARPQSARNVLDMMRR